MVVPQAILQKLRQAYPRPIVDESWLQACYDWVKEEFRFRDNQLDDIFPHLNTQFLSSDLSDSAVPNSGIPTTITNETKKVVIGTLATGGPILVQITAITDIGYSAFHLRNVRQTRIDKADMAGLADEIDAQEDGPSVTEGEDFRVPDYPRSMLRMALSDGSRTLQAMEYKRIPTLQLGTTQLGCKLLLKNVTVRRGIALLEPRNTTVYLGSRVEEIDTQQDILFSRGLRLRMGLPEIDHEEEEMARRAQAEEPSVQRDHRDGDRPQREDPPVQATRAQISQQPSVPVSTSQSEGSARARRLQVIQQALNEERSVSDSPTLVSSGATKASPLSSNVVSQPIRSQGMDQSSSLTTANIEESISFDDDFDFDFDEAALQQIDEAVAQAVSAQSGGVKADAASVFDINSDDDNVGRTNHPSQTHKQSKGSQFTADIIDLSD